MILIRVIQYTISCYKEQIIISGNLVNTVKFDTLLILYCYKEVHEDYIVDSIDQSIFYHAMQIIYLYILYTELQYS